MPDPKVTPAPKPALRPGERIFKVGNAEFITTAESTPLEVGEWVRSVYSRFDHTLLGAFEQFTRQEGKPAALASYYESQFTKFASREV